MDKRIPKVLQLLLIAIIIAAIRNASPAFASPGILASSRKDGNWEIFRIDPITGDAKNLTNHLADD